MIHLVVLSTSFLGAFFTFQISTKYEMHKVRSSALLSLIVALFFHFFPDIFGKEFSKLIPIVFIGASFVGMTAEKVLNKYEVAISGLIFGLIYIVVSKHFKGFGGVLGMTACIAILSTTGLKFLYELVKDKWKKP